MLKAKDAIPGVLYKKKHGYGYYYLRPKNKRVYKNLGRIKFFEIDELLPGLASSSILPDEELIEAEQKEYEYIIKIIFQG